MADAKKAVGLVVALMVGTLVASFLMPVAIGAIAEDPTDTYTQESGETVELKPGLNATVTSVTDATSATYSVTYDGDSVTGESVNVGSSSTVTVDGVDVTINPTTVTSTNATTDYTYPTTAGWANGAGALWAILPLMLVLPVFLLVVSWAIQQF